VLGQRVPCAVIKLGARGAVAVEDGTAFTSPGFRVDALDTTGAGDSFAAGFVSAYVGGKGIEECLRVGNACGALSTRQAGGTAAQPDAGELRAFLRRQSRGAAPLKGGREHVDGRRTNGGR
jgi:sugar/nucleoside kinase (ribokinase family)